MNLHQHTWHEVDECKGTKMNMQNHLLLSEEDLNV